MDPAAIVKLVLISGIALNVVAIGVRARPADALALVRKPDLAVRSMAAMFVFVPAFVMIMSVVLGLTGPVPAVLLALSVAPMPPLISNKELDAGGDPEYAIGLQMLATLFSIAVMPLMILLAGMVFGRSDNFYPVPMVMVLMITVLAPMLIGMTLGHFLPDARRAIATWAGRIGWTALGLGAVALLAARGSDIIDRLGDGTLLICVVIVAAALAIGHLFGGPKPGNRRALAITCAARHPGVAISVVTPLMPEAGGAVLGMAGLYWLVSFAMTIPYLKWQRAKAVGPAG
jgi:BASS family bile acid:Na+ symporter